MEANLSSEHFTGAFRPARGSRIGRYAVVRELGRGAAAVVYYAWDPLIDRPVALKVIDLGRAMAEHVRAQFYKRFLTEARAAGKLHHPGIVMLYDVGRDEKLSIAFIALEFVEGESLSKRMRSRRFGVEEAVRLCMRLLEALQYAHEKGVVHRDIKPGNVILTAEGLPKIADFGIAKLTDTSLTAEGTLLGSPNYMSPEQAQARPVDRRSDIFSLGLVLYEALAGSKAFPGATIPEVLYHVVHSEPRRLRDAAGTVPEVIASVVHKALAKDPADRFQDASCMLRALSTALDGCTADTARDVRPAATMPPPAEPEPAAEPAAATPPQPPAPAEAQAAAAAPPEGEAPAQAQADIPTPIATAEPLLETPAGPSPAKVRPAVIVALALASAAAIIVFIARGVSHRLGAEGRPALAASATRGHGPELHAGGDDAPGAAATPAAATAAPTPGKLAQPAPARAASPRPKPTPKTPAPTPEPSPTPVATEAPLAVAGPTGPSDSEARPAQVLPFEVFVTHNHKVGQCQGMMTVHADRVEFVSPKHPEPIVLTGAEVKKAEYRKSSRVIDFTLRGKSLAKLGGARHETFSAGAPIPDHVATAIGAIPR